MTRTLSPRDPLKKGLGVVLSAAFGFGLAVACAFLAFTADAPTWAKITAGGILVLVVACGLAYESVTTAAPAPAPAPLVSEDYQRCA
jgi:hypothetical protein